MLKKSQPIKFKRPGSNMELVYLAVQDGINSKHMLMVRTKLKPNQIASALVNLSTCGMIERIDTAAGSRYAMPGANTQPAPIVSCNNICISKTKGGRPTKPDKQAPLLFRPQSKAARDAFYRMGGSRWINRMLEGLASTNS